MTATKRKVNPLARIGDPDIDPVTETYLDVQDDITLVARKFAAKYRQDVEECLSLAHGVLFLEAYRDYRPEDGAFDRWVVYRTRCKLLNNLYVKRKRDENNARVWEQGKGVGGPVFRLVELLDGLSPPAAVAVRLLLAPPPDGRDAVTGRQTASPVAGGYGVQAVRWSLHDAGWDEAAIDAAFDEIRNSL